MELKEVYPSDINWPDCLQVGKNINKRPCEYQLSSVKIESLTTAKFNYRNLSMACRHKCYDNNVLYECYETRIH